MLKSFVDRLLGRPKLPSDLTYEEARGALETQSIGLRRELAGRADVEPEILYYLAADAEPEVRRLIAGNPGTPQQANKVLADDANDEVRIELARKIARLVPGLDPQETGRIRDLAIEVLEKLASDHLPRVRQIVAEEVKAATNVPVSIVQRLARDIEVIVSSPVLEYSPLLSDDDLKEIIASGAVSGALEAIARRHDLSTGVSDAVVATLDVSAVAALLANPSAQIREDALDRIIDNAEGIDAWHKPLVLRPELSLRAVRRVAGFVASSLLALLETRKDLDADTVAEIRQRVRTRIATEKISEDNTHRNVAERIAKLKAAGKLDDHAVAEAIENNDRAFVIEALAALAGVPAFAVERVMAAKSGKAVASMVWRAGLAMRIALKIQTNILKLAGRDMLLARNGVDFPLTEDEMVWHLSYFGIKGPEG
ncbi:MAG: DUF2336 domain-containing protein [Alphaproteobacteria bacterium]|nr:DUF2336 domain-containing protein [Alphaproteobacteria bacterium]